MSQKKFLSYGDAETVLTEFAGGINNKVNKVTGKGLSTNDYTTEEKTKLAKTVGKDVSGETFIIDNNNIVAQTGAEIFNNYSNNKATGSYSHAEGSNTTASGNNSHAEDLYTIASGNCSHAEGYGATASGGSSHAEGGGTTASGAASHAEGIYTNAGGDYSHAEGYGTTASSSTQHVQGKYNIEDVNNEYAFIIGNGTNNSTRSNAFAIGWNGLIYVGNSATGVSVLDLLNRVVALETRVTNLES